MLKATKGSVFADPTKEPGGIDGVGKKELKSHARKTCTRTGGSRPKEREELTGPSRQEN